MYSYIDSVFPEYTNTSDTLYKKLYSQTNTSSFIPGKESFSNTPSSFTPNRPSNNRSNTLIDVTEPYYKSPENEVGGFYNRVAVEQREPQQTNSSRNPITQISRTHEAFEHTPADCTVKTCDDYIQHILGCPSCRKRVTAKLGITSQSIFELVSYIIFGIFILMLLEKM